MIEYDECFPMPPQSVRRYKMIPEKEYEEQQAYIARLEVAYLEAETSRRKHLSDGWRDPDEAELSWDESQKMARESLERIKAGEHR